MTVSIKSILIFLFKIFMLVFVAAMIAVGLTSGSPHEQPRGTVVLGVRSVND